MKQDTFQKQLLEYSEDFKNILETPTGDWSVKGFIDIAKNIYTISVDTKVISKIIELMIFPVLEKFAKENNYQMIFSAEQNHYPDVTVVFPPQKTYLETIRRIKLIAKKLAKALSITGPFNIQFLAKNNAIKVIELNLRASRSFPFVSKISGINFIEVATNAALGEVESPDERRKKYRTLEMDHVGVKCPQFSFSRLSGADPVLSVEMASTGEVGCFGRSFEEAFLKSMISVGFQIPKKGVLFSAGDTKSKLDLLPVAQFFAKKNLHIFATPGTADFFAENGVIAQKLEKISASGNESMLGLIRSREIDLVINIPKNYAHEEVTDGYRIRRAAVDANVALVTNTQVARAIALALEEFPTIESLPVLSEKEYF